MASNIDSTKPTAGAATTESVRQNFAYAKAEIEQLQTDVTAAQGDADSAASAAAAAQSTANTAVTNAATAQSTANSAASAASSAASAASAAASDAAAAQSTADNAAAAAAAAQSTADAAATSTELTNATSFAAINTQSGTTYTLATADANYNEHTGNLCIFTSSSAVTVTIPQNSDDPIPIGSRIDCIQSGTGKVTFGGTGVTINSQGSKKSIAAQYVGASLTKTATNTWLLLGALVD